MSGVCHYRQTKFREFIRKFKKNILTYLLKNHRLVRLK